MVKHLDLPFEYGDICVHSFGYEDDGALAHWGPGSREPYILHFVIDGRGFVNGVSVGRGQGFSLSPDEKHEYHADPEDPWKYLWIIFTGSEAGLLLRRFGIGEHIDYFCFHRIPAFEKGYLGLFCERAGSYTQDFGRGILMSMLSLVERSGKNKSLIDGHVERVLLYMQNHYHENIRISDVASALYMDEGYLYNIFAKKTGISPKAYLSRLRIERAKQLLMNTDYSVTEIARSVGYTDVLCFSRFFKTHTGVSPQGFRKSI